MKKTFRRYHLGIFISVCLGLITLLPKIARNEKNDDTDLFALWFFSFTLSYACWLVALFFTQSPSLKHLRSGWTRFAFCALTCALLSFGFHEFYDAISESPLMLAKMPLGRRVVLLLIRGILFGAFQFFVSYYMFLMEQHQKSLMEIEKLKRENLETRLSLLRRQVSPHFLFNSLSTLKTMVTEEAAKKYIMELSNVYRYLLNYNNNHLSNLQDELDFSQSYLHILKERFEQGLHINTNIDRSLGKRKIPAMALQLLIENAIKHNIVSVEQPLEINIYTDENKLVVSNNIQPKMSSEKSSGTGLKNIDDRYQLLSQSPIVIDTNNHQFTVKLPLLEV